MKLIEISANIFDNYAKTHSKKNYFQYSKYMNAFKKDNRKIFYIALVDNDNNIKGAGVFYLIEKIKFNTTFNIGYIPRGFLLDYDDDVLCKIFFTKLKKLLNRKKCFYMIIDLPIYNDLSKNNETIKINSSYYHMTNNIRKNAILPPLVKVIDILDKEIEDIVNSSDDTFYKNISKSKKLGLELVKTDLEKFADIKDMPHTTYFKNDYYEKLCDKMPNNLELYHIKLDPIIYLKNARDAYLEEMDKQTILQQKLINAKEEDKQAIINEKLLCDYNLNNYNQDIMYANNFISKNKNNITLGGILVLNYGKTAHIIFESYDPSYNQLEPNKFGYWYIILEKIKEGYEKIYIETLNNIDEFIIKEYKFIGEYLLISNQLKFNILNKFHVFDSIFKINE